MLTQNFQDRQVLSSFEKCELYFDLSPRLTRHHNALRGIGGATMEIHYLW